MLTPHLNARLGLEFLFPLSSGAVKGKEKELEGEKSPEKEGNNGEEERRGILHTRCLLTWWSSGVLGVSWLAQREMGNSILRANCMVLVGVGVVGRWKSQMPFAKF